MTRPPDYFANVGGVPSPRVAVMAAICDSWVGTPFRKRSCVKGPLGGVDCGGFVGAALAEAGAIPAAIALPPYDINHAEHCDESVLREWFEQPTVRGRVRRLDEDESPLPFDLVFPKLGRTEHHLAFWYFSEIYHVVRPSGVCRQSLLGLAIHGVKLSPYRYRLLEANGPEPVERATVL